MRWYVSRNGQTTETPVEDAQVTAWIQQGMTDAMIRDEHGGQWMPLGQSPFRTLLPMHMRSIGHRLLVGFGIGMVGLVCGTLAAGIVVGIIAFFVAGAIGAAFGNVKIA